MDESNTNLLDILNTIKLCNNSKNRQKWALEANSHFFKKEIEKLKIKMEYLDKDKVRIEDDIRNIIPKIEIMEQHQKTLMEAFRVSQDSILYQNMHLTCVVKSVQKNKEEGDNILKDYRKQIDKCRKNLEETSPNFKTLKEKTVELQKVQYNIKMLHYKIKERQWIDQKKLSVRQSMFYKDCINLATVWLGKRKYDESVRKLEAVKKEETELIKKLMNNNLRMKEKQSHNLKNYKQKNEDKGKDLNMDTSELPYLSKDDEKVMEPFPTKSLECLNDLINKQAFASSNPVKVTSNFWHNSNYLANNQHVPLPCKVKIIENKIINVPVKDNAIKQPVTMTIQEKSNALEMKFQKLVTGFNRSASQREKTRSQSFVLKEKTNNYQIKNNTIKNPENMSKEEKSKVLGMKLQKVVENLNGSFSQKENNRTQNFIQKDDTKSHTGIKYSTQPNVNQNISNKQDPQNHILSQETDLENIFSQESGISLQVKLSEFRHDAEGAQKISNQDKFATPMPKNTQQQSGDINFGQVDNKLDKQIQFSTIQSGINKNVSDQMRFEKKLNNPLTNFSQYFANNDKNEVHLVNEPKLVSTYGKSTNNPEQTLVEKGSAYHFENPSIPETEKRFTGFPSDVNMMYTPPVNISKDVKNYGNELSGNVNVENNTKFVENQYNFGDLSQFIHNNPPDDYNGDFVMSPVYDNSFLKTTNENKTDERAMPFGNSGFAFDRMNFDFNF